jgi:hypothetical protein
MNKSMVFLGNENEINLDGEKKGGKLNIGTTTSSI